MTPLLITVTKKDFELTKYLIEKGVDVDQKDKVRMFSLLVNALIVIFSGKNQLYIMLPSWV